MLLFILCLKGCSRFYFLSCTEQFRDSAKALVADKLLSVLNDLDDLDIFLLTRMPEPFFGANNGDGLDAFSAIELRKSTDIWFIGRERTLEEVSEVLSNFELSSEMRINRSMGEHSMLRMESFGLVVHAKPPKLTYNGDQIKDSDAGWRMTEFGRMLVDFIKAVSTDNHGDDNLLRPASD